MNVIVTLARAIRGAVTRRRAGNRDDRRTPRHVAAVDVAADVDTAMMASAGALRQLGARITRYDAEVGALEARAPEGPARIVITAAGADANVTRLDIETDDRHGRALARRFRRALSRPVEQR